MQDMFPRQSAIVRIVAHRIEDLGCDHQAIATGPEILQSSAKDLLARSLRIHVCRVEEVDSQLKCATNEWARLFFLEHPWPPFLRAVGHRAQAQARHLQSGTTKSDVVHRDARAGFGG